MRDGPLEAYGRDAAYYRSARKEAKRALENQRLDELKSETNQFIAMEKKQKAKATCSYSYIIYSKTQSGLETPYAMDYKWKICSCVGAMWSF